jgi:hypothetical protein
MFCLNTSLTHLIYWLPSSNYKPNWISVFQAMSNFPLLWWRIFCEKLIVMQLVKNSSPLLVSEGSVLRLSFSWQKLWRLSPDLWCLWSGRMLPTFWRYLLPQSSNLKMEAVCSSKMLINIYQIHGISSHKTILFFRCVHMSHMCMSWQHSLAHHQDCG